MNLHDVNPLTEQFLNSNSTLQIFYFVYTSLASFGSSTLRIGSFRFFRFLGRASSLGAPRLRRSATEAKEAFRYLAEGEGAHRRSEELKKPSEETNRRSEEPKKRDQRCKEDKLKHQRRAAKDVKEKDVKISRS
uniref:Uncharacterized protein n=1 Tax=Pediastrum duplex TaxID=3105 RepID=A0A2U8GIP0_PEDDU|nr:hypothetical protein [Pediastrum duplex]